MAAYHPFVIRVDDAEGGFYPVEAEFQGVLRSGLTNLDELDEQEVQRVQTWVESAVVDEAYARDLGNRLFLTLFPLHIREMFREARQRVAPGERLRVVLNLPLPEPLANLPWELIHDPEGEHGYLARSRTAPLVRRYTDVPFPHSSPPKKGPLRVLVVTASPEGTAPLSAEEETDQIVQALDRGPGFWKTLRLLGSHRRDLHALCDLIRRLLKGRRYEVTRLHHATQATLQEHIREADGEAQGFHVIHVIGHGQADGRGAAVFLERDSDRKPDPVSADRFAELVGDPPVSLVVLNACETAASGRLFESVANATVHRGVPAVIGMQVPILDRVAVDFSREFYRAWASGEPIEVAIAYARRLVQQSSPGAAADWSIPVLYMGHTGGLTLQPLERAHRLSKAWRHLIWAVAALLWLLGTIMTLLAIPDTARTIRTTIFPFRCVCPYPMTSEHNFNVVVADLPVVDEHGSPVRSGDGRALAEFLYQRLVFAFEGLDLQTPYEIRSPAHTCPIRGRTAEDRRQAAAALAESVGAHVVIYGVLTEAGKDSRYSPEFYVNYKGFEQEEQIAGPHALGSDLYLELPFDAEQYQGVRQLALSERVKALGLITIGIAHHFSDDPDGALPYFEQAETTGGWSPRDQGKAVIYLFLGHVYAGRVIRRYNAADLEKADEYYRQALSLRPTYPRALSGQANVLYLIGRGDPEDRRVDIGKLKEAKAAFEAVLELNAPEVEDLRLKVHFVLGKIHWYLYMIEGGDWLDQAEAEFSLVKDNYERDPEPRWAELTGHAYAWLGTIAYHTGEFESAEVWFTRAKELVSPYYQAAYYSLLGDVHEETGQIDLAIEAYERALRIAIFYCDEESAEQYYQRIVVLEKSGAAAEGDTK